MWMAVNAARWRDLPDVFANGLRSTLVFDVGHTRVVSDYADFGSGAGAQDLPVSSAGSGDRSRKSSLGFGYQPYLDRAGGPVSGGDHQLTNQAVLFWGLSNMLNTGLFLVLELEDALPRHGKPEFLIWIRVRRLPVEPLRARRTEWALGYPWMVEANGWIMFSLSAPMGVWTENCGEGVTPVEMSTTLTHRPHLHRLSNGRQF